MTVAGPSATVAFGGADREAVVHPRLEGGPLVVGDEVDVEVRGDAVVVAALRPRRTLLSRGEFGGARNRARPLVANADLLLVVAAAAAPPLRPRFIDRYLVAGELGGLECGIVVTKRDLPHDSELLARARRIYGEVGYPVLTGSTDDPAFVAAVRALIDGRVAALAGHSGVGKSSLTQVLTGVARTIGEVSRRAGTGRHTTTDPRLVPLPGGGAVIDTAGVRNFYLPPMEPADLAEGFPEIAAAASGCRFRRCRHAGEAGCAVPGRVTPERLDSYRRLAALL
ncbi:MAG TPA: ribosome small subunit-dependent GTPase A [Miltoncostaeaceae bacterium]|nr:ribosome small subunit-dependent GTPase A [Miltoncostaeaceae bacterium]